MHRRRGVGVAAVRKKQETETRYASLADKLEATQEAHVADVISSFRSSLEDFARKHKKKIRSDPLFRSRFTEMCYEIGVDPLQSSKGFWSEMLGVGDFFFELGIKIVELCAATRSANGGLMSLDELEFHLIKSGGAKITQDDIKRAISKLDVLGDGFRVVNGTMVLSVPVELNRDQTVALNLARTRGFLTARHLQAKLNAERAEEVLSNLLQAGFAWLDAPPGEAPAYYFPSIWLEATGGGESL
ncbi:hypothetical protein CTAYLR_007507 [Chrysophaeum taylorii]|uniref:Vacuolar-sorting protein SNF8 n=1 Tax=Chrysophaeum taylorii TaxID=2483200 RepID=A0AAD7ULP4_9STRA|nr:hypothetical protein CTAYLR_007507 [Chrysophaeum taylorii]